MKELDNVKARLAVIEPVSAVVAVFRKSDIEALVAYVDELRAMLEDINGLVIGHDPKDHRLNTIERLAQAALKRE